jgi:hypothetical protein
VKAAERHQEQQARPGDGFICLAVDHIDSFFQSSLGSSLVRTRAGARRRQQFHTTLHFA